MKRRTMAGYVAASMGGWLCRPLAQVRPPAAASAVITWNAALKSAIAATRTPPTIAARAISMAYEAAYNAWACYDVTALHTLPALAKRPRDEWNGTTRAIAVSHALHLVLLDLFPSRAAALDDTLASTVTVDTGSRPAWWWARQSGLLAGASLLQQRHRDGSNQLGDLAPGAYADYTGYAPVNTVDALIDPLRWQPLRVSDGHGGSSVQHCLTPYWGWVRPFALSQGSALRPAMDHIAPTADEFQELLTFSANLTDERKAIAEYWAGGPGTETPPGLWTAIAEKASLRDGNTLDQDVKLFFALGQALLDASIAAWDAKRAYESCRPIGAIRLVYRGQTIQAWGGPGLGTQTMHGEDWWPYQPMTFVTPPFPEFVSGHSTFSAAAAEVLKGLRGDRLEIVALVKAGSSLIESGTPAHALTLRWSSLSEAVASAGLSRRYGGIHFAQGDLKGRSLGAQIGTSVLAKCLALFDGTAVA